MFTKKILGGLLVSTCALSVVATAAEFSPASVRALGMGGSNVASTHGVNASYWNPAAYGFFGEEGDSDNNNMVDKSFGISADVVAGGSIYGPFEANRLKAESLSDPSSLPTTGTLNAVQIQTAAAVVSGLSSLDSSPMGANLSGDGNLGVRVSNFGIGARASLDATISVSIDNTNVGFSDVFTSIGGGVAVPTLPAPSYFTAAQESDMVSTLTSPSGAGLLAGQANAVVAAYDAALATDPTAAGQQQQNVSAMNTIAAAAGTDITNNKTALTTRGAQVTEVGFTYVHAINDELSVGGVLKYMQAQTFALNALLLNQNTSVTIDRSNVETHSGLGLDLGVMYRIPNWQVGLTVRNINSPSFQHEGNGTFANPGFTYELKPQAKLGGAWIPTDTVTVELGYDLTKNKGAVTSSESQYWNLGVEWDVWNVLALRLGAFQNMAQTDIGLVPTIGLGFNLWAVRVDLAVAQSTKTVDFDGSTSPAYFAGAVALAADF